MSQSTCMQNLLIRLMLHNYKYRYNTVKHGLKLNSFLNKKKSVHINSVMCLYFCFRFDYILTAETIYSSENYPKLHSLLETLLKVDGKMYLSAIKF